MRLVLKNTITCLYILYTLSLFLFLDSSGYAYKATAWVKANTDGSIKTLLNLYDVHVSIAELIDYSIKPEDTVKIERFHANFLQTMIDGCKKNNSVLLLEQPCESNETPEFKKVLDFIPTSANLDTTLADLAKNHITMVLSDHRGLFYRFFWQLSGYLVEIISLQKRARTDPYSYASYINQIRHVKTQLDFTLNLIAGPFNITPNAVYEVFTMSGLKKHLMMTKESLLRMARNSQIQAEIEQLLLNAEQDITSWVDEVSSLVARKSFNAIEIESLPLNKLYAEIGDFSPSPDSPPYGVPLQNIFRQYFMELSWDKVFDAGQLLEIEKAFKDNDDIVILSGERHAAKLDEWLEQHSYTKVKEYQEGKIPPVKEGDVTDVSQLISPLKLAEFFDFINDLK